MDELEQRIAANVARVEARIASSCERSGRRREDVLLLCVTKQRPDAALQALYRQGHRAFGENRAQEIRERIPSFPADLEWHFIGSLQTNKAKYLPGLVSVLHSLDRAELAQALDKAWQRHPELPPLRIMLQFNIAEEAQKHGAGQDAALDLLKAVGECQRLRVEGLMAMAPYGEVAEASRPVFRALRELRDHMQQTTGIALPHLSMGMTGDYEVAIEEGATIVRVGTALFE